MSETVSPRPCVRDRVSAIVRDRVSETVCPRPCVRDAVLETVCPMFWAVARTLGGQYGLEGSEAM